MSKIEAEKFKKQKCKEQAGAELCQAQGKFRRVRLGLDLCLI